MPKKKKTKAQVEAERLKAEEEARKRAEEEERVENERRLEAEARAKVELEGRIAKRREERARLTSDRSEMRGALEARLEKLNEETRATEERRNWSRVLNCNRSKWPSADAREANAFLSEEADESSPGLERALETGNVVARIIRELESLSVANRSRGNASKDIVPALCDLVLRQLDYASSRMLLRDDIAYSEAGDFSFVAAASRTKIGIWACQNRSGRGDYAFDLSEMNMSVTLPQSLHRTAIRVIVFPSLDFVSRDRYDDDQINLGDVVLIEMLEMPPPCERLSDGSIIRKIQSASRLTSYGHETISSITKSFDENGGNNSFLQCRLQVPKTLVVADTLSVAHWCQDTKTWNTDSISDQSFDKKSSTLTFKTLSVGRPISLVQSRLLHFPYKSWCLGPVGTNSKDDAIHFSINTHHNLCIKIEVKQGTCKLLSPDIPQLHHIRRVTHSPGNILIALSESGIHLLPTDPDAEKLCSGSKSRAIEEKMNEELSLLSTSFYTESCSRINGEQDENIACFKIKESDVFTGGCDPFDMFTTIMEKDAGSASAKGIPCSVVPAPSCDDVKCSVFDTDDIISDGSLNLSLLDGEHSHMHLIQSAKSFCTPEAIERVKQSNVLLTDAVRQILELTRPFYFC